MVLGIIFVLKKCRHSGFESAKLLCVHLWMCGKLSMIVTAFFVCIATAAFEIGTQFSFCPPDGGNALSSVLNLFSGRLPNIIVCRCSVLKILYVFHSDNDAIWNVHNDRILLLLRR